MAKKFLKRSYIIMALLFVAGVFCVLPKIENKQTVDVEQRQVVSAEETVASGEKWVETVAAASQTAYFTTTSTEDGSFEKPFLIENAADLAGLAYDVNEGQSFLGKYFSLTADIDLSGKLWTPIGWVDTTASPTMGSGFNGYFLGNCHKISNIAITEESLVYTSSYAGLFGYIGSQENVYDLRGVYDLKLDGYFYCESELTNIGVLAGYAEYTTVSNVRDNTQSDLDFTTIFTAPGSKIIKSGSFDGVTADLTSQNAINASVTVKYNGAIYYLVRYRITGSQVTNGANFYYLGDDGIHSVAGKTTSDGKIVNIPVLYSGSTFSVAGVTDGLNLSYSDRVVTNLAGANAGDVYARWPGVNTSVKDVSQTSFADGLLIKIYGDGTPTFEYNTVTFDYEYGPYSSPRYGRLTEIDIPIDTSFSECQNLFSEKKVFERLGYTLTYFSNRAKTSFYKQNDPITDNSFPIDGETYYFPMNTDVNGDGENENFANTINSTLRFVNGEGETEFNIEDAFLTYDGIFGGNSNYTYTPGQDQPVTVLAGYCYFEVTLKHGYNLKRVSLQGFDKYTGTEDDYTTEDKNNDSYAETCAVRREKSTDEDNSITFWGSVHQLVGNNGIIVVELERKWVDIDVSPWFSADGKGTMPDGFTYGYSVYYGEGNTMPQERGYFYSDSIYQQLKGPGDRTDTLTNINYASIFLRLRYNTEFKLVIILDDDSYMISNFNIQGNCQFDIEDGLGNGKKVYYTSGNMSLSQEGQESPTDHINPIISVAEVDVEIQYYYNTTEEYTVGGETAGFTAYMPSIKINQESGLTSTGKVPVLQTNGYVDISQTNPSDEYRVKAIRIYNKTTGSLVGSSYAGNLTGGAYAETGASCLAQNGADKPTRWDWGNNNYLPGGQTYLIKVLMEKVKYKVEIKSKTYGENDASAESSLFDIAPTITYGAQSSTTELWISNGATYKIDWTLNELGNKLLTFTSGVTKGSDITLGKADVDVDLVFASNKMKFDIINAAIFTTEFVDVSDANIVFDEFEATFIYDASKTGKIAIKEETLNSITISSEYAFKGWILSDNSTITNGYANLLSNETFITLLMDAYVNGQVSYTSVKAYLSKRSVEIVYQAYGTAEKVYDKAGNVVSELSGAINLKAQCIYDELNTTAVENDVYNAVGYTFNSWELSKGSINEQKITMTLTEFGALFGDSNGKKTWSTIESEETRPIVTLTATWNKISYYVSIDGVASALRLQVGNSIVSAVQDKGQSDNITFTIGNTTGSKEIRGYSIEGYTIESVGKTATNAVAGEIGTVTLTINQLEALLNDGSDYRFTANDASSAINLKLTTSAKTMKLHVVTQDYYTVVWNELLDDGDLGQKNGTIYEINVNFGDPFTNLATALNKQALVVTRNYCNLIGFNYEKSVGNMVRIVSHNGTNWVANETTYEFESAELIPVWEYADLTDLVKLSFGNGANNGHQFTLATSHNFLQATYGNEGTGITISNGKFTIKTGEEEEYNVIGQILNTKDLQYAGATTITFTCDYVSDINSTAQEITRSVSINVVKNDFDITMKDYHGGDAIALTSIYTGTNEIDVKEWIYTLQVAVKYDWKHELIDASEMANFDMQNPGLKINGTDFSVGRHNLDVTVTQDNIKYVGSDVAISHSDFARLFNSASITLGNAVEVVKRDLEFEINQTFTFDAEAEYYSVALPNFTCISNTSKEYQFNCAFTFKFNLTTPGTYTGEDVVNNSEINGLTIAGHDSENFNTSIASTSRVVIGNFEAIEFQVQDALSYVFFNGVPTSAVVSQENGQSGVDYTLTITYGESQTISAVVKIGYIEKGALSALPDNAFLSGFNFDFSGVGKNVGTYTFSVTNSNYTTVNTTGNNISVSPKEISVSGIEKQWDGTKDFDSSNSSNKIVIAGAVETATPRIIGQFAGSTVGTHAITVYLVGTDGSEDIDGSKSNYVLAGADSGEFATTGTITNGATQTIVGEVLAVDYGEITEVNLTSKINAFAITFKVNGSVVDLSATPIDVNSRTLQNPEYSKGGYLKAGNYTIVCNITCEEYGCISQSIEITLKVNKISAVVENADGKTISKMYDKDVNLKTGLNEKVGQTDGLFKSEDILAGDEVIVTAGSYSDAKVGNEKTILSLSFGGDGENYNLTASVVGNIEPAVVTFEMTAGSEGEPKTQTVEFNPDEFDAEEVYNSIKPSRTGYVFQGWEEVTIDNIKDKIEMSIPATYTVAVTPIWVPADNDLTINFDESELMLFISGKVKNDAGELIDLTDEKLSSGDTYKIVYTQPNVTIKVATKVGYKFAVETDDSFTGVKAESFVRGDLAGEDFYFAGTISIGQLFEAETVSVEAVERNYSIHLEVEDSDRGEITAITPQDVTFGGTLTLNQSPKGTYTFVGWFIGDQQVASKDATSLAIDGNLKAYLLDAELAGDTFVVTARYSDTMMYINITATKEVVAGADAQATQGKIVLSQTGISNVEIDNGSTKTVLVYKEVAENDNDLICLEYKTHNVGYQFKSIAFKDADGDDISNEYFIENDIVKFKASLDVSSVVFTIEPMTHTITVKAGWKGGTQEQIPSIAGGKVYLCDSEGNILNNSDAQDGVFEFTAKTGETFCLYLEAKTGYSGYVDLSSGNSHRPVGSNICTISDFVKDVNIVAKFETKTNKMTISMVVDTSGFTAENAGYIVVDADGEFKAPSPQYSVTFDFAENAEVRFEAQASLGYNLIDSENQKVYYYVKKGSTSAVKYEINNVDDFGELADWEATGRKQFARFTLGGFDEDVYVFVVVVPKTYNLKFVNNVDLKNTDIATGTAQFNRKLQIADGDITNLNVSEIYTFTGYYTSENAGRKQYIDSSFKISNDKWGESGYEWNGLKWQKQDNYDLATNTFTLYAGWDYKKVDVNIAFTPSTLVGPGINIRAIVLNDQTDNVSASEKVLLWTTEGDTTGLMGQVPYKSILKVKIFEFEGYEFKELIIQPDGDKRVILTGSNFIVLDEFVALSYDLTFVYQPKYTIEVQNKGTIFNDGGSAWVEQDGMSLTGLTSFDSTKPIMLKAKANEGYVFKGFVYTTSNGTTNKLPNACNFNGVTGEYSCEVTIASAVDIVAVFEGKPVEIEVTTSSYDNGTFTVLSLVVNGETFDFGANPTIRIGDIVAYTIEKHQGYKFSMFGGEFTFTGTGNVYVYTSRIGVTATQPDGENYKLNLTFATEPEEIKLIVSKAISDNDGELLDNELALVGGVYFVSATGSRVQLDLPVSVMVYYGEHVSLEFDSNTCYKLENVWVITENQNVPISYKDYINGNKFEITEEFLASNFSKEINIRFVFARKYWSDAEAHDSEIDGFGTEESPFIITSAEEFAYIATMINEGASIKGVVATTAHYHVATSIDFAGRYWIPIGTAENPFAGTINLGNHNFTNINLHREYANPKVSYGGLFWHVSSQAKIIQISHTWLLPVTIAGVVVLVALIVLLFIQIRKYRKQRLEEYL